MGIQLQSASGLVPSNVSGLSVKTLSTLEDFSPTIELAYFKEILHDKLTDDEILELKIAPELHADKLAPFNMQRIKELTGCDKTFLWLVIKDPELLQLELEKPLYFRRLREIALGESEELDPKNLGTQLKAIDAILKQLEKLSTARKQKGPAKGEVESSQMEAKLLRALPKQYARLSEFELNIQKKQCEQLAGESTTGV